MRTEWALTLPLTLALTPTLSLPLPLPLTLTLALTLTLTLALALTLTLTLSLALALPLPLTLTLTLTLSLSLFTQPVLGSSSVPEIVHRDSDLLIVHKPAGLPTTAPSGDERCLVRWVEQRFPELRAHPTSRLDSQVSGLVTFALNKAANQRLLEARRAGRYERLYLGITLHSLEDDAGDWCWPISIDPRNAKLRIAGPGRGERDARTRFRAHSRAPHGTLLHLTPQTGRTHQLRVHCAEAGAPLFGDHPYGGERRLSLPDGKVVSARRVMLHCSLSLSLSLSHDPHLHLSLSFVTLPRP